MSRAHVKLTEEQRLQAALYEARVRRQGFRAVLAHIANAPEDADISHLAQWQATKEFVEKRLYEARDDANRLKHMLETRTQQLGDVKIASSLRPSSFADDDEDETPISNIVDGDDDDVPTWMQ